MDKIRSGGVGQSRALGRGMRGAGARGIKMNGLERVVQGQSARVHGDGSLCGCCARF